MITKRNTSTALFLILSFFVITGNSSSQVQTYSFSITASPTEGGEISPSIVTYEEGEKFTLRATTKDGFTLVSSFGDTEHVSNPNDEMNSFTMPAINDTLEANFEQQETENWPRDADTEIVDITNPVTGRTWMDRNLGASQAATSFTDSDAYGDWYQWGRAADGHHKRNSSTISTLSSSDQPGHGVFISGPGEQRDWRSPQNDGLWKGINKINNPCPVGYRLPIFEEWEAERQSWSSNNSWGAFGSPLKLPLAGMRTSGGFLYVFENVGLYWSSTVSGSDAHSLGFNSNVAGVTGNARIHGHSVRCIKADYEQQDTGNWLRDTETEIVDVTNPATGKTWMDRNLGATRVATSPVDSKAYGDLYQWGRAADGHHKRIFSTTRRLSENVQPGHNVFVLAKYAPGDWLNPQNDDLWQGVNGINNPCPSGYRVPTKAEWEAEADSWSSNNWGEDFPSDLNLPISSGRDGSNGFMLPFPDVGAYWSSSISGKQAYLLFLSALRKV